MRTLSVTEIAKLYFFIPQSLKISSQLIFPDPPVKIPLKSPLGCY